MYPTVVYRNKQQLEIFALQNHWEEGQFSDWLLSEKTKLGWVHKAYCAQTLASYGVAREIEEGR